MPMNAPRLVVRSCHATAALWWCLALLACNLPAAHAAKPGNDAGLRLLQAQLPTGASLRRLDCDHLANTVRAATLAHRKDAVAILSAALTLDEWDARRKVENRLSCPCVSQLFQAAANAAPDRAATLLETAQALYPECADALTTALGGLITGHQVAMVSRDAGTGTGSPSVSSPAGNSASSGTTAPSDSSPDGDTASNNPSTSLGGFGLGAGTGFPGAPGFGGGSGGGGGFPLPTPVPVTVTASVNN